MKKPARNFRKFRSLLLRIQEFHVEAEAPHFLDEDVERFRHAGLEVVLALDDRLVDLGPAATSSDFTVSISCRV